MLMQQLKHTEACNLLFEKGFLSHEKVSSMNSIVVQNISSGYQYFTLWLSALLSEGTLSYGCFATVTFFVDDKFPHMSNIQKSFLSWQSKYVIEYRTWENFGGVKYWRIG